MQVRYCIGSILGVAISALTSAIAQPQAEEVPKLAVVLSGGGAKGFCHIGVLKVLEEEGIRPHLITGTSMGSLVGGLYACGYSARDIEAIMLGIHWDELMTNKVGLDKIAIEEKPYYGRWLAELPFDKGIHLPTGLIRGQKIQELARHLTLAKHGTHDFAQLPIPFLCIATDVVRGEALVQDHGFLPDAMRASMAIPTFFTPLVRDPMLLVDGGEMRNFPVSDARERGATHVIGVDLSDGLAGIEDLGSATDILVQSAMFHSLKDNDRQRTLCDALILPDYAPYSTGSFEEQAVPFLIQRGYEAADRMRPQLRAIAAQCAMGPGPVTIPPVRLPDSLRVDRVEFQVAGQGSTELLRSRFKLLSEHIGVADLESRIDLLYGTRHFDLVQYRVRPEGTDSVLVIEATPAAPGRVGVSLNYDTYHEVSLGLLFQLYDKVLGGSRLASEAYLGRYPSAGLDYLKYFGNRRWAAIGIGGVFTQGAAFSRDEKGRAEAEFRQTLQDASIDLRSTASRSFSIGIRGEWRRIVQRPAVFSLLNVGTEETPIFIDLADIDRISGSWVGAGVFALYNTMDQFVYPRRGWEVQLYCTARQNATTQLIYTDEYLSTLDPEIREFLEGATQDLSMYDAYARGTLQWRGRIPFSIRGSFLLDGLATFTDEPGLIATDRVTIGGFRRPEFTSFSFWGLQEYDADAVNFVVVAGGMQWRLWKNFFWQGLANSAWTGFRPDDPSRLLGRKEVFGYGTTFGLRGPFGVLQVGVATNTANNAVNGWLNIGFRL